MKSRREIPSGIVLYPEDRPIMHGDRNDPEGQFQLGSSPIGPNIARQLGFVTNARMDSEGTVIPGTVHAVGYDPAIARAITDIYYPGNGRYLMHPQTKSEKSEKQELVDMLIQNMYEYLAESNLALDGIARTLASRRIDIITPMPRSDCALHDNGEALVDALKFMRPRYGGESDDTIMGNVWIQAARGVMRERPYISDASPNLDYNHPLYGAERLLGGSMSDHEISTSRSTLQPQIHESFKVTRYNRLDQIVRTAPGFALQADSEKIETYHRAVYELPVGPEVHGAIADVTLAIMEQDDRDDADMVGVHPEEMSYEQIYDPHWASDMIRRQKQTPIAGAIDPLDDYEWRSRLS